MSIYLFCSHLLISVPFMYPASYWYMTPWWSAVDSVPARFLSKAINNLQNYKFAVIQICSCTVLVLRVGPSELLLDTVQGYLLPNSFGDRLIWTQQVQAQRWSGRLLSGWCWWDPDAWTQWCQDEWKEWRGHVQAVEQLLAVNSALLYCTSRSPAILLLLYNY